MRKSLLAALSCLFLITACNKPPTALGVHDGSLSPCPDSPNCVSSQSKDKKHFIKPMQFSGSPEIARAQLASLVQSQEGARVVDSRQDYLLAEFTSKHMKFVDDVEFLLDTVSGIVHVRSASRTGYSDLGVNRKRVEKIRTAFERLQQKSTPAS